jgi:hypothetical protein
MFGYKSVTACCNAPVKVVMYRLRQARPVTPQNPSIHLLSKVICGRQVIQILGFDISNGLFILTAAGTNVVLE